MAEQPWIVPDELWQLIAPLLPAHPRRFRYPGRRRLPDRPALCGILFSCCTPVSPGAICRSSWASARGSPAGAVWRSGSGPASGTSCTPSCSPACAPPARSTSRARSSTPARCRPKRGHHDGPEPGRPRPAGVQAPPPRRGRRAAALLPADRRQPQRHHAVAAAAGRRAAGEGPCRTTAQTSAAAARRPRLRPRPLPASTTQAWHQAPDWATGNRARLRLGPPALGRGAHLRLAAQLQASARALRAPRRHARSVSRSRLLHHLLPATEGVIVKPVLGSGEPIGSCVTPCTAGLCCSSWRGRWSPRRSRCCPGLWRCFPPGQSTS